MRLYLKTYDLAIFLLADLLRISFCILNECRGMKKMSLVEMINVAKMIASK